MRRLHLSGALTLLFFGAVVACSIRATAIVSTDAGPADDTVDAPPPPPTVTADAATRPEPVIYAHSSTTLYRFDATTSALTKVADFSGCATPVNLDGSTPYPPGVRISINDLAIAADGTAFVVAGSQSSYLLGKLDLTTAVCTPLASDIVGPRSLAFVPKATGGERLVAYYNEDAYKQVDPANGQLTPLGTLGRGYYTDGDIATLDGRMFVSAGGNQCHYDTCLLQVDPETGAMVKLFGDLGSFFPVTGLAASSSALYAFSDRGLVIRAVPLDDGGLATSVVVDAGTETINFIGAASGGAR